VITDPRHLLRSIGGEGPFNCSECHDASHVVTFPRRTHPSTYLVMNESDSEYLPFAVTVLWNAGLCALITSPLTQ
jgi:hypothetical protein